MPGVALMHMSTLCCLRSHWLKYIYSSLSRISVNTTPFSLSLISCYPLCLGRLPPLAIKVIQCQASVAVALTFAFCILRNKIGTNLKIFEEIAEA
jgi:hypothetical protein